MSVAADIGSVITGIGGSNGLGDDVGNVICAIKGTCQPQNVTYVQNGNPNGGGSSMIWMIGGGIAIVLVLVLVLNK